MELEESNKNVSSTVAKRTRLQLMNTDEAKTMQTHLRSNIRLHEMGSEFSLPPCEVSLGAIKDAMMKCLGLKWGRMSKVSGEEVR